MSCLFVEGFNWTVVGVVATAGATVATFWAAKATARSADLMHQSIKQTQHLNAEDKKNENSKFYLQQCKECFEKAISLLIDLNNNNINWHHAIEHIKTTDNLRTLITEKHHQEIYVIEHQDTAFRIVNILNNVTNFCFYYGVPNYDKKDPNNLFKESYASLRIDPISLNLLCAFIEKSGQAFRDLTFNNKSYFEVYKTYYFQKKLNEIRIENMNPSSTKVIDEYIEDFKAREKSFNNELIEEAEY